MLWIVKQTVQRPRTEESLFLPLRPSQMMDETSLFWTLLRAAAPAAPLRPDALVSLPGGLKARVQRCTGIGATPAGWMSRRNWRCNEEWNEQGGLKGKGGFFFLSQAKFHGTLIQDQHTSVCTEGKEGGREGASRKQARQQTNWKRLEEIKECEDSSYFHWVEERRQSLTAEIHWRLTEQRRRKPDTLTVRWVRAEPPQVSSSDTRWCLHQTVMPSGHETAAGGGVVRTMSSEGTVLCCHGPASLTEERYESGGRRPARYVLTQEVQPGFE